MSPTSQYCRGPQLDTHPLKYSKERNDESRESTEGTSVPLRSWFSEAKSEDSKTSELITSRDQKPYAGSSVIFRHLRCRAHVYRYDFHVPVQKM